MGSIFEKSNSKIGEIKIAIYEPYEVGNSQVHSCCPIAPEYFDSLQIISQPILWVLGAIEFLEIMR